MTSTHVSPARTGSDSPLTGADSLAERYHRVRQATHDLQRPLSPEDCTTQSMPDASPTKWHLGHTTWFFERLVVAAATAGYQPQRPEFWILFNSYYNSLGRQHPRPRRGLLSRPSLDEVLEYRAAVDRQMERLFAEGRLDEGLMDVVEVGLNHEQQHQELIVTDVKHLLSCNPLYPAYHTPSGEPAAGPPAMGWVSYPEGLRWAGFGGEGFAYDNERPRHRVFVEAFDLATRPVTCGEYLEFMREGGYDQPLLWLSNGWATVQETGWRAPGYWEERNGEWLAYTLSGLRAIDPNEPVCHISYFEADAFARWAGVRLPSEFEWETAATNARIEGNLLDSGRLHPSGAHGPQGQLTQLIGDVWEWTKSGYDPYPGYAPPAGALGEYNSKFMCSQLVLRGGSCATPASHIRATYRNFFPPEARWQFSGIRLARDGTNQSG
jgi:ergothioneine biosynthesis protein EgtB